MNGCVCLGLGAHVDGAEVRGGRHVGPCDIFARTVGAPGPCKCLDALDTSRWADRIRR